MRKQKAKRKMGPPIGFAYKKKGHAKPIHGQQVLLRFLFDNYGGPKKIAADLKLGEIAVQSWPKLGNVPVKYITIVQKYFDCPVWGLNYKLAKATRADEKIPSWEQVARMYELQPDQVKLVVKYGEPK